MSGSHAAGKRRLIVLLITALLVTGLSGCGKVDWIDWEANTWSSAQLASILYYFPIRTTSRSEGAINKAQALALGQIGTWSDRLVRSSQALHGQLNRLEKPLIQLLAQLSETDFLNNDDVVLIMEHLAARRAFSDSLQTQLAAAVKKKAVTPYEQALDQHRPVPGPAAGCAVR